MAIKKIIPFLAGVLLSLNIAKGQLPSFRQFVYPHNGVPVDSGYATFYKPDDTDSLRRKIGEFIPNYWDCTTPVSWKVQLNDSGRVKIQDTTNQTSLIKWFCRSTTGSTLLPPTFPGSHEAISVYNVVEYDVDSVDAKCYKIGGNDTLRDRFRVNINTRYEIYFDGSLLNLVNGDSVKIEASSNGRSGSTKDTVRHRFIDADTLPCFELLPGEVKENLENKIKINDIKSRIVRKYVEINSNDEVSIYNSNGQEVKKTKGPKIAVNDLSSGIYFIRRQGYKPEKFIVLK